MRDFPCPASTAFPGSANPVLHRFCHSTIFCRSMMHSLDVRKHVLKARGSLLFALITNHASPLGPTTRHVTRTKIMALWESRERRNVGSRRLWVVVLQRWLGGYTSSRMPRTQGFQTTSLCSTNPVAEPQRSSTISRICFMSEFFFMFSQVLLIPRSGLDRLWFVFLQVPPTCFPHTWTLIFNSGYHQPFTDF